MKVNYESGETLIGFDPKDFPVKRRRSSLPSLAGKKRHGVSHALSLISLPSLVVPNMSSVFRIISEENSPNEAS